jgi:hypothetical protein
MTKRISAWNDQLPNQSDWVPQHPKAAADTLRQALQLTCRAAQQRIAHEAEIERIFNLQNFDSGAGLEDIVRRQLRLLLPTRYDTSPGVLNDATGATVGDCDVLITNRIWAPVVKLGATEESRRVHFPIEAAYSIIEVKQTATYEALDAAMGKIVAASRLDRQANPYGHITENQHLLMFDDPRFILNPLLTAVLVARPEPKVPFRELAQRFFYLNRQVAAVSRDQMVRMLCVLDAGVAYYSVRNGATGVPADFCCDRHLELTETIADAEPADCFYRFFVELLSHLTRSVVAVHDLRGKYGASSSPVVFFGTIAPQAST